VRMAWWRREPPAPDRARHTALAAQGRLAVSHVGARSPPGSLPRLAGHARQHRDPLAQRAPAPGGVLMARDGLAPQGGEPHRWCIRARPRGFP